MATEKQFEYFKYVYERERSRNEELINRGKTYLGGLTVYLGFLYSQAEGIESAEWMVEALYVGGMGAVVGAIVFSLRALGVYRYSIVSRLDQIIEGFGDRPPTDSEFFDERIVELAVARGFDASNNDRRASALNWASWLFVVSVILNLVSVLIA